MALRLFLARHRVHFIHVGPIHKYQHRALFVPDVILPRFHVHQFQAACKLRSKSTGEL